MYVWSGSTVSTKIIDVDDPIEWSLLIAGTKTQMRSKKRLHEPGIATPSIVMMRHDDEAVPFILIGVDRQELSYVTASDASREGFSDLPTFKRHWCTKEGDAFFSPSQRVWVYEVHGPWRYHEMGCFEGDAEHTAVLNLIESLYPVDIRD